MKYDTRPTNDVMTDPQRRVRAATRNAYLCESVATMEATIANEPHEFVVLALREMIDECKAHGVDNYGDLPMIR